MLSDNRYHYDDIGNITSIREEIRDDFQCYTYDELRRLSQAWTPGSGDCQSAATVEGLGGPAPYWNSYEHDAIGNRVSMTEHAAVGGTATTQYTTPAAGSPLPHAVVGTTTTVDGTVTDEATYSYDETGNMITRPGQTLTWDTEGRLKSNAWSSDGTETVTSHIYTPDGSRLLRKNNDGSATLYLPGQEISVDEHGQIGCARYYTFAGSTFAVRTSAGLSWLFNDHQGTASMTQQAGSGTATYRYQDPYGGPRGLAAVWPSERGFVGGTDDPSGLTHLGAREYDPGLGVFISVDPVMDLTNPKQMHAYTYANGNPTTFSDPTGLYTPERGGVPCIDGDCSFHNKNGSLKNKNQCKKNACGTNPLYVPAPFVPNPPQRENCGPMDQFCQNNEYWYTAESNQKGCAGHSWSDCTGGKKGGDQSGPFDLFGCFARGLGMVGKESLSCTSKFKDGDWLTEALQGSSQMQALRIAFAEEFDGDFTQKSIEGLRSQAGVADFLGDLLHHISLGSLGSNGGTAFVGSFDAVANVAGYDRKTGQVVVEWTITNTTDLRSFTRPPWSDKGLYDNRSTGPFATITQTITWTETITISKVPI